MHFASILLCFFSALFLSASCLAKELSIMQFDELNLHERKFIFVFFYADDSRCTACSKSLFTWDLLEKRLRAYPNSKLAIGQVNCDIHKELCTRERIDQMPAVKLYTAWNGITQLEFTYDMEDFDLPSLESFLHQKLPKSVLEGDDGEDGEVTVAEADEIPSEVLKATTKKDYALKGFYELSEDDFALFLGAKGENLVYFYTPSCATCQKLQPKWDLVFKKLELKSTRLSRIDCDTSPYVCLHYNVEEADLPTLLWISNGKVKLRLKSLHISPAIFFNTVKHLLEAIEEPERQWSEQLILNEEDFRTSISRGVFFVHFTVPWSKHCIRMEPAWRKLLERTAEVKVKLAKVDCSVNEKLCNAELIDGYPTLYLYRDGKRLAEYEGTRTTESFLAYLQLHQQQHLTQHPKDEL